MESTNTQAERFEFQAEMQRLLNIIIHSLYSNKDIFLRELISNASDALNRLRFESIKDSKLAADDDLEIWLEVNTEQKTLTIKDNGVGMTRQELIDNIGTIAKSGTKALSEALASTDADGRQGLIGQFGVGFYSAFMVADKVEVDTRSALAEESGWLWSSDGEGGFELQTSSRSKNGTSVILHLKDDEYCNPQRLEEIVRAYSSFVTFPIRFEGRRLNDQEAIWNKSKSELSDDDYKSFYNFIAHDYNPPRHWMHFAIDAPVQFKAILYIPQHIPLDTLYNPSAHGIQLYASNVLIQERADSLLPLYLRFIRGVVDSDDIPLNVSREMVQSDVTLRTLQKSLEGRILRELEQLATKDNKAYTDLWQQFGRVIKEGITSADTERLTKLLRFDSTHSHAEGNGLTSLAEYKERMPEDQEEILYMVGSSLAVAKSSSKLEYFNQNNLEVLLLHDHIDNFITSHLREYDGTPLVNIESTDIKSLDKQEDSSLEQGDFEELCKFIQDAADKRIKSVRLSKRLVNSPACLVYPDSMTSETVRMMRSLNQPLPEIERVLEINPKHPIITKLNQNFEGELARAITLQLIDNCLFLEGDLETPEVMVSRVNLLIEKALEK